MEVEMGIISNISTFVRNGVSALRSASSGKYNEESDIVREYRNEIYGKRSGWKFDRRKQHENWKKVGSDIACAMNRYKKIAPVHLPSELRHT